jgi:membrane-associated phospholipid phosphatase
VISDDFARATADRAPVGGRTTARRALATAGVGLALVVLSYFFLDRPLAELVHSHLQGVQPFVWLTRISEPLRPLALIALVVISIRLLFGHGLGGIGRSVLLASLALVVASVFTRDLKDAFGRTWPLTWVNNNPSYFKDGVFGFSPFHGGPGYAAFPSGHMTAISAVAIVLWYAWPQLRWLSVLACALVAIGLIGANYHWLSDVIAGAMVGGTVGAVLWQLLAKALTTPHAKDDNSGQSNKA